MRVAPLVAAAVLALACMHILHRTSTETGAVPDVKREVPPPAHAAYVAVDAAAHSRSGSSRVPVVPEPPVLRTVTVDVRNLRSTLLERYTVDVHGPGSVATPVVADDRQELQVPNEQLALSLRVTHRASSRTLTIDRVDLTAEQSAAAFDLARLGATGELHALHVALELPPGCSTPFVLNLLQGRSGRRVASVATPASEAPTTPIWLVGLPPGDFVPVAESATQAWSCVFAPVRVHGDTAVRLSLDLVCAVSIALQGPIPEAEIPRVRVALQETTAHVPHAIMRSGRENLTVAFTEPGRYVLRVDTASLVSLPSWVLLASGQTQPLVARLATAREVEVRLVGVRRAATFSVEDEHGAPVPLGAGERSWRPGTPPLRLRLPRGTYTFSARVSDRVLTARARLDDSAAVVELR